MRRLHTLNRAAKQAAADQRAGKMIEQLELEVGELLAKAEQVDATPLQESLTIPAEITRRQQRKAALEKARAQNEARAHAHYAAALGQINQWRNWPRAARK